MTTLIIDICRTHLHEATDASITSDSFVGAGTSEWNQKLGQEEAQWGSVFTMEAFGRDRPEDPAEAERVLQEVADTIAEVRRQARKRLGWPLATQGAA